MRALVDTRTENPVAQEAPETTGSMGFYMIRFMLCTRVGISAKERMVAE